MADLTDEDFSAPQRVVLDFLKNSTESCLLTGVAGCGKSTVLRHWLKSSTTSALILAPTGIAALNVNGSTIHRAFGFHPNMDPEDPRVSLKTKSLLYSVDTIVLDEVSMVRADLLGAMDIVLRSIKRDRRAFGGVRMVMVGDFYQLPPVVQQQEERWMEQNHGSRAGWCFYAPCFRGLEPTVFYLGESFRSRGDSRYTDILNGVRNLDPCSVDAINEIARPWTQAGDEVPRLCARKADVAQRNEAGLRKLGAQVFRIDPVLSGDIQKIPREEQEPIYLAEGARVMCTRNGAGYVNGSLGSITSLDAQATTWDGRIVAAIEVKLDNGNRVCVPRDEKEVIGYDIEQSGTKRDSKPIKVVLASVQQYSVSLAYAWTIHKSQGQTLERACVDLGRGAFAHGQTYVALSRLTSAAGLYLSAPLSKSDLLLDPDVVSYFSKYAL